MVKFFFTENAKAPVQIDGFEKNCWIDMVNPSDDECEEIAKISGISEDMLKAALDEEERDRKSVV